MLHGILTRNAIFLSHRFFRRRSCEPNTVALLVNDWFFCEVSTSLPYKIDTCLYTVLLQSILKILKWIDTIFKYCTAPSQVAQYFLNWRTICLFSFIKYSAEAYIETFGLGYLHLVNSFCQYFCNSSRLSSYALVCFFLSRGFVWQIIGTAIKVNYWTFFFIILTHFLEWLRKLWKILWVRVGYCFG